MPRLAIEEWEWDDGNLGELARHGVSRSVVLSVALEHPRFRRNRTERSATFQMIGPDRGGALWTICIVETILRGGGGQ